MWPENGLTLVIKNRRAVTLILGYDALGPNDEDHIHFRNVKDLREAVKMWRKQELVIKTEISPEIMRLVNEIGPVPAPPQETVPYKGLFFRDEFEAFKKSLDGQGKGVQQQINGIYSETGRIWDYFGSDVFPSIDRLYTYTSDQIYGKGKVYDDVMENKDEIYNLRDEMNKKITVLDRLPDSLADLPTDSLIATPERTVNLSWKPSDWFVGSLASGTGANFASTIRIRTNDFKVVEPGARYAILLKTTDDGNDANESSVNIFEYRADDSHITSTGWVGNEYVFTASAETTKIKMLVRNVKENITITTDYISIAKPVMSKIY